GAYVFAHDVVRRVVYADLAVPRRRWMHERLARGLESELERGLAAGAPIDEAAIANLAHHAAAAGQAALAARACIAAGRRCLRVFANGQAEAFARRGMHYAEQLADSERVAALLELFQIRITARRPAPIGETVRALERLAEQ